MNRQLLQTGDLRADSGQGGRLIGSIPYNSPAQIGGKHGFEEILLHGCFDRALRSKANIYCLKGHDPNQPLANRDAGTLKFRDGPSALTVEIRLDLSIGYHADVYAAVKRGDLSGLSFGFDVEPNGVNYRDGGSVREIIEISKLYEFSPCTFPAYQSSTLNARSNSRYERNNPTMKFNMQTIREIISEIETLYGLPDREGRSLSGSENVKLNQLINKYDTTVPQVDKSFPLMRDEGVRNVLTFINEAGDQRGNPHNDPEGGNDPDNRGRFQVGDDRSRQRPFRSFGEQLQAIIQADTPGGRRDARLDQLESRANPSGMSESNPTAGGHLVQDDFSTQLLQSAFDTGQLAGRVTHFPIGEGSNGIKLPVPNHESRANGSRWGGIQLYHRGEAGAYTDNKPEIDLLNLELNSLIGLCYLTDELLADATALENFVDMAFKDEFNFKMDDIILNGSGVAQGLGIMNSDALIEVSKEDGQSADTILYANILKMWSRMPARNRKTAVWLINQDAEPQLYSMSLEIGTGGAPVFMPGGGASGEPYSTLFNRPIIPMEQCQTLGDSGDIVLFDPTAWILADKGIVKRDASIHVRFIYGETTLRFTYRYDGRPVLSAPITPANGTNTLSPFVVLEDRD